MNYTYLNYRKKIYQASKKNRRLEMFRLQKILITSKAAKLKAVRRVTQDNRGKRTAGIDGIKLLSPEKRLDLANLLILNNKLLQLEEFTYHKKIKKQDL